MLERQVANRHLSSDEAAEVAVDTQPEPEADHVLDDHAKLLALLGL